MFSAVLIVMSSFIKILELEKAATILEGGGTFLTEPLGNLDSGDALGHEMIEKIVIATLEFEANHKECLRVLPYLDSAGEVVVQLFVFSEFGLQTSLKSSAQEYFDEKRVKLVWSDLYNNAAYVLNAAPVQYPSGEPKRLNATDVDNINQTINGNLHVLVKHRNITAVQASYKITNSKQTEKPCITIYVLGKGFIPIGESTFPPFLGSYPVDVVNGFWYRTKIPQAPTKTQVPSDELCLGTSIGVKGKAGGGTLGAIVKDSSSGIFYALSCNHVMKHPEESEIIHPALADYVNYLNWHLTEYAKWVKNTISRDQVITQKSRFASNFLEDKADLSEKFKELNQIRDAHRDPDRETPTNVQLADNHKKWFEEGESKPPRVIGKYIAGVSRNVKWSDGQEYYIDAAVAQLTEKEVKLLQLSKVARIIGTGDYPSGELRPAKDAIHSTKYLCKSGRTTEFTNPGYLVDSSIILKGSFHEANGSLTNVFRQVGFCQSCAKRCGLTEFPESTPPPPCDSCRKSTDYLCQNLWFKNCLCIKHTLKKAFSDDGDSGAVVFERHASEDEDEDEDEHNGLLGFGIIFAGMEHLGVDRPVSLASPLEVALDALSKEISNNSRLKLVSDYNE